MSTRTISTILASAPNSQPRDSALGFHNRLIAEQGVDKATGFSDHGRNARFEIISECLEKFIKPKLKVVDYGCNDGDLVTRHPFTAYDIVYTGIDLNHAFIKLAKKRHINRNARFMVGNVLMEETNDWLIRHRPDVIIASGVLCYRAGAKSYPELVCRLFAAAGEALIFNVLVDTKPKSRLMHVWSKHKILSLVKACGCRAWDIKHSYLPNDMTIVMRKHLTHAVP